MSNNDISNSTRSANNAVDEELVKLRLDEILDSKGNKYCADCPAKKPLWASFLLSDEESIGDVDISGKLAVLVCTECAQHHLFELGEKRCHIKYLKYSHELKLSDIDVMELSGNKLVNKYYEANLNRKSKKSDFDKDLVLSDEDEEGKRRSKFIKNKYKKVKYRDHSGLARAIEKVTKKQKIKDMTVQKAMEDASEKSLSSRRGEDDATPYNWEAMAKENISNDNQNNGVADGTTKDTDASKNDKDKDAEAATGDESAEKKEEEDAKKPEELNDLEKLKSGVLSVKDRRQRALAASVGSSPKGKDVSQSPRRRDRTRSPASSGRKMPLIGRGRVKSENAAAKEKSDKKDDKYSRSSSSSSKSSRSKKTKGIHLSSPNIGGGLKKAMGKVTGATKKALGGGRKSPERSPKRKDSEGVRRAMRRPSSFSGPSSSAGLLALQKEFSQSDFAASSMMPGVQGQLRLSGSSGKDGSGNGLQSLDDLSSHLTGLAFSKSLTGGSAHGGGRADASFRSSTGTMGSKPPAKKDESFLDTSSGGNAKSSTGDADIDGCASVLDNLMSKSLGSRSKPSARDTAALIKSVGARSPTGALSKSVGAKSSTGALGAPKIDFLDDDLEDCVQIFDDTPISKDSFRSSTGSNSQSRSKKNEAAFHNSFAIDGAAGTRIKQSSRKNRSKSPTRKKSQDTKSGDSGSGSFGDDNPFTVLTANGIPGFKGYKEAKGSPGKGKKPLRRRSSFGDVDSLKMNMGSLGILVLDEKKKEKSRKEGDSSSAGYTRSSTEPSVSPRKKKSDGSSTPSSSRSTKKNEMRKLHSMDDAESRAMVKDIGSLLDESPKSKSRPDASLKSSTRSRTGSSNKKSDSSKKSDKTRSPSTRKKKPVLRRNSSLNDLKASVSGDTFKMNARMNMSFALSS